MNKLIKLTMSPNYF